MTSPAIASRRRIRRGLVVGGLVLFGLWLATSLVTLGNARGDLEEGRRRLRAADGLLSFEGAESGQAAPALRSAAAAFEAGDTRLDRPQVAPLRLVPVLGRQIRSGGALAASSATVLRRAAEVAEAVGSLEAGSAEARVEGVRRVRAGVTELAAASSTAELGPENGLVGSLARARQSTRTRLDELDQVLRDGTAVLDALSGLLAGDRKVLVLGATNAEMRVGQAAATQFGVLSAQGGSLSFSRPMSRAALARPPAPLAVEDPDIRRNWPFLDNDNLAYVGTTPRFEVVARRAAALVEAATGDRFALVVQVDAVALARLTSLSGAVEIEGAPGPLQGDALLRFLLHDQYAGIPDVRGGRENAERREALSRVAAVFAERVNRGDLPLGEVAAELGRLGRSRNVLAHALDPVLAPGVRALKVDGDVPAEALSIGLLNAGASKLDQFVGLRVDLTMAPRGDRTQVTARVSVRNQTPTGEPPYVLGEQPEGTPAQGYAGFLVLTVPGTASSLTPPPDQPLYVAGTDGPLQVMATYLRLGRGQRMEQVFTFDVPTGTELAIVPSGRSPGVGWYLGEDRLGDDEPHRIRA